MRDWCLLLLGSLLLVACGKESVPVEVTSTTAAGVLTVGEVGLVDDGDAPQSQPRAAHTAGYTPYVNGVIGAGEKVALYFYASWNPMSARADRMIRDWYTSEDFSVSTFRVDIDSPVHDALRKRYDVEEPDTWVLVDGSGRYYRRIRSPTAPQLRLLLAGDLSI